MRIRSVGAGARRAGVGSVIAIGASAAFVTFAGLPAASAAQAPVGLGKATSFAVLAGQTVTNTGNSVISGNLGVWPGTAVTNFPPGKVVDGSQHRADVLANEAQSDLTTAYIDAAGRTPAITVSKDLGGQKLSPGVYKSGKSIGLTGTVVLDAHGDANAVFIFQAGSTLLTASSSTVELIGGAQACNVFWQVGSSATLGTDTTFVGNILALTSASLKTGATVEGRVLARNGAVTLEDNTITRPSCTTTPPTTTTVAGGSTTTTVAGGSTTTVAGGSTTTVAGTPIPSAHTGEPWAGWPYWTLAALLGLSGFLAIDRSVRIRRRHP